MKKKKSGLSTCSVESGDSVTDSNNQIKIRVKSSVAMNLTFDSIVYDIESVSIEL